MKTIFLIGAFFLFQISFAQVTKNATTKSTTSKTSTTTKSVTSSKNVSAFKKITSVDSLYSLSGDVMIKNGHDEKVKVSFRASVLKDKWNEFTKTKKYSDIDAFELVAAMLSMNAQYTLKNTDSFVPLPSQFFMWSNDNNSFMANFKMMGRNGYGNLTETSTLAFYNPYNE
jgi:hypothetical protein